MRVPTSPTTRGLPRTLVIIPALNERESIADVILGLGEHMPEVDVVVVDDGSTDDTAKVAAAAGAHVVRLPFNLGVGGALRAGLKYAARNGYDRAVQVDADGQHDCAHVRALLIAIDQGAELAVGSRFTTGSGDYEVGRIRQFAMRIMSWLVTLLLAQRIADTTSGFRAFGPKSIELLADRYPRDYLSDTIETLLLIGYAGLPIVEVPVQMHDRAGGMPSARNIRLAYHFLRMLVVIGATASLDARRTRRLDGAR